jgi:hypothetical protein
MNEFYKPHGAISITKANDVANPERGIRLYCTQVHESWSLQIRGPLGAGRMGLKDSETFVIANARLNSASLLQLRDAIDEALAEAAWPSQQVAR